MTIKRRFFSLAIACLLLLNTGVFFAAEQTDTYAETVIQLGAASHEDQRITRILARPGNLLDYFLTIEDENMEVFKPAELVHYQSSDGGKTWKANNLSWLAKLKQKYPQGGDFADAYITDNGEFYGLVSSEVGDEKIGDTIYGVRYYKIFCIVNGVPQEVPSVTLGNPDAALYSIGGITDNGEIVIFTSAFPEDRTPSSIDFYDLRTGSLKQHTELPRSYSQYSCYTNGAAYIVNMHDGVFHVDEFNTQSGELMRSIPIPDTGSMSAIAVCGKRDGAVFVTSNTGLYRLDPGKNSLKKLLNGASCRLGKNAGVSTAACTDDGIVYVAIRYIGETMADPKDYTQGKLYCYRPK